MLPLSLSMLADWRLYSVVPILYSLYQPIRAQQRRRRAYVVVVDLFLDPGEFQWLIRIFFLDTKRFVDVGMTQTSTSSSPSHEILPMRRCIWCVCRSKMRSVSNLSNFDIRSLIKLALSSVSPLLWSLSSFKSSRTNPINTSFPVDMLFRTEFSFANFPVLFVSIHKPPIHSFFFDIQKFSHIFYFLQWRSLIYVVIIALQQRNIRFTQKCSLRLFRGNAMDISEVIVKKHFPVVHTSTDFTQKRRGVSLSLHLRMSA